MGNYTDYGYILSRFQTLYSQNHNPKSKRYSSEMTEKVYLLCKIIFFSKIKRNDDKEQNYVKKDMWLSVISWDLSSFAIDHNYQELIAF